jgi:hypothetical protein
LNCFENQLSSLIASNCISLKNLYCFENQLTSINVSGCTSLRNFDCRENQLTSLDVSGCTALYKFNCRENQLTSINVSGCTSLRNFDCSYNGLPSLDVSGCTRLSGLACKSNQLHSLDLTAITSLNGLSCSDNFLFSLNLCEVRYLYTLEMNNMPTLQTVYVSFSTIDGRTHLDTIGSVNVKFKYCGVGIEENISAELSIYPNPTNGILNVETGLSGKHAIVINTLKGNILFRQESDGPDYQIDLSSYEKGIYAITIRSKEIVTTRKIIKL